MRPCRKPIFCILPPHILRNLATKGDAQQRAKALKTLSVDPGMRLGRATRALMGVSAHRIRIATGQATRQRTIYDCRHGELLPGKLARAEGGEPTGDVAVDEAYDGLGATFDFFWDQFMRSSIDDEGLKLDATVHFAEDYTNAFWNGDQMVFGDGDGKLFNRFTISLDVIGHELAHGVTGDEANLVYLGQPGALNESVSDVFGSLVKQYYLAKADPKAKPDWLIGAGLFTAAVKAPGGGPAALRSMKAPGTAYDDEVLGRDPQPGTMSKYVETSGDNGGVHINSGIPNRAFYLVATALGGHAWEKAGRIWYDTLRDQSLRTTATFQRFAQRTSINASHLYGSTSVERKAVQEAWHEVGVRL